LSQCSTCREVVVLAAPEAVTASTAPTTVGGARSWLHWPGIRWIAVMTACIIVAAVGISLRPTLSDRNNPSQRLSQVVREEERQAAAPLTDTLRSGEASNANHVAEAKKESASASSAKKPEPEARNEIDVSKSRVTGAVISPKTVTHARQPLEK